MSKTWVYDQANIRMMNLPTYSYHIMAYSTILSIGPSYKSTIYTHWHRYDRQADLVKKNKQTDMIYQDLLVPLFLCLYIFSCDEQL